MNIGEYPFVSFLVLGKIKPNLKKIRLVPNDKHYICLFIANLCNIHCGLSKKGGEIEVSFPLYSEKGEKVTLKKGKFKKMKYGEWNWW